MKKSDKNPAGRNPAKGMLTEGKDADETGRLEGKNVVIEALRAGHPINKIYIEKNMNDPILNKIYANARENGIVVTFLDKDKLTQTSGSNCRSCGNGIRRYSGYYKKSGNSRTAAFNTDTRRYYRSE